VKKWKLSIAVLLIVCINVALFMKFHYPELPFTNKTKDEVVHIATTSNLPLRKVTQQGGYVWFITDDALEEAVQSLKQRMTNNGWHYVEQDGSGYFFEKDSEKVVIESHQWTSNYLLFQLPIGL